ncbi:MAG: glycosyltransferase [Bacteroidota bacterium]
MDLSIIIVNYNVKHFLEQCLHSVKEALEGLDGEVIVVDNNSVDGSVAEISSKFPWVTMIANKENVGFSRANNQAIKVSKGRYALLLNPDTVVEENTFRRCIEFMDGHPDAGAMGVKMIDGKGAFLPESKRSLPTPMVSFYKMFGLSSLFPGSKRFGKYHLGYLDKEETHVVDVLAGAFMCLRRETLDKTGLLDETFFMYGEDIDLSYRITLAGYKNYYYPGTTIIHYKGESTKKGSLNYVKMFYQAMIIFAGKHFTSRKARTFSMLINIAIYFRAALSVGRRFLSKTYRPVLDAILIFLGYLLALPLWEQVRFDLPGYYPPSFLQLVVPGYILIWLIALYYSGGYDKPVKPLSFLRGHLVGTVAILVIYAMLPADWRFSRALIFLGSLWAILSTLGLRIMLHLAGVSDYEIDLNKQKRMVVVGKEEEALRVSKLLQETQAKPDIVGFVSPSSDESGVTSPGETGEGFLGSIEQIDEITSIHKVDEIVFCSKDLPSRRIIGIMTRLIGTSTDFKIAPPESLSIIGSNSINTAGDLYTIHFNSIGKASNRRNKRLFDAAASLFLLVTFPFWFLLTDGKFRSIGSVLKVLLGLRTWVGYLDPGSNDLTALPRLKRGILNPAGTLSTERLSRERIDEINVVYAKDYRLFNDLLIITRNFRKI